MNICIVSTDYPAPSHPKYVFVEQLVNEMVNQGVDISVIAPQSITRHLLKGSSEIFNPWKCSKMDTKHIRMVKI